MGYFSKFNRNEGIPFMDGADKIDIPQGEKLTIVDYGFLPLKKVILPFWLLRNILNASLLVAR